MFSVPPTDQCPRNRGKPENGKSEGASQRVALSGLWMCSKGRCQIWHPDRTRYSAPLLSLPESPERFHLQTPNTDTSSDAVQTESYALFPRHEFFSLDAGALTKGPIFNSPLESEDLHPSWRIGQIRCWILLQKLPPVKTSHAPPQPTRKSVPRPRPVGFPSMKRLFFEIRQTMQKM